MENFHSYFYVKLQKVIKKMVPKIDVKDEIKK